MLKNNISRGLLGVVCLGLFASSFVAGCGPKSGEEYVKSLETQAKPGMSMDEVEKIYGAPTKKQDVGKDKMGGSATLWIWENKDKEWDLWARFGNGKLTWTETHNRHTLTKGGSAGG